MDVKAMTETELRDLLIYPAQTGHYGCDDRFMALEELIQRTAGPKHWHTGQVDHVWHVWINQEASRPPTATRLPDWIDPSGKNLYGFKSMLGLMEYLPKRIGDERRKALPTVHQQCSHSVPEPLADNHLQCWLGQKLGECPILKRLDGTFAEFRAKPYYREITDEQVDGVKAATCAWHLYTSGQFVDWNEGAVQDSSDRKFWGRVYDNLSCDPQPEDSVDDRPDPG